MRRGDEEAFTLLELVFALVLLSIGVAALVGVLQNAFRSTAVDIHRTDATAIAAQGLATLAAAPPTTPTTWSVTRNGQAYTLTGTSTDAKASNGDLDAYPVLAVTVSWTDAGGSHSLAESSARYTSPPATVTTCTTVGAVTVVEGAPPGDPSIDVSWQEPNPGGPGLVTRWEVQISTDGSNWTTAVANEPPLAPGQTHQLEIGGLAANAAYQSRVIGVTPCGALTPVTAVGPTTPPATSSGCNPGAMTLGPATAERVTAGAAAGTLTSDITVVVTSPGPCSGGVLLAQADTGRGIVSGVLYEVGSYSYVGTLAGLAQAWDLGVHPVTVSGSFTGPSPVGLLCVEEEGTSTC